MPIYHLKTEGVGLHSSAHELNLFDHLCNAFSADIVCLITAQENISPLVQPLFAGLAHFGLHMTPLPYLTQCSLVLRTVQKMSAQLAVTSSLGCEVEKYFHLGNFSLDDLHSHIC